MTIRYAGIALIAGVALAFVVPLFMPGYALIDPVDQTDFVAARDALGNSPILAHWATFFTLVSLLLMTFGLFRLFPLASRQGGLWGRVLQFGIIVTIIEWSCLMIATGMRHFVIHLMQRSNMAADGPNSPADFETAALAVHIDMTAVTLAFVVLYPVASIAVGLGLAGRFASMDIYKGAAYVMAAAGLLGLVNFLFAMNAPSLGIETLLMVNNIALYIAGICFIVIGYGMYRGRNGLAEAGSPNQPRADLAWSTA